MPRRVRGQNLVSELKALASEPNTARALRSSASDIPQSITDWLGQLYLLYGVPFIHMVPDERMLPAESIRFFILDPNWLSCLVDGAMSIGTASSKDTAFNLGMQNFVR